MPLKVRFQRDKYKVVMMKNLFFILASFGWISTSKVEIKGNKLHEKTQHISEDIVGNFEKNFTNFFTAISKDQVACNYYAPNQKRCQRVFVNVDALKKKSFEDENWLANYYDGIRREKRKDLAAHGIEEDLQTFRDYSPKRI